MHPINNADWSTRRERAVPRGIANAFQIYVQRAGNAEIWDVEGRHYIDFAGGIAVLNVGHRHPRVMERVAAQAQRFTHTCFQVLPYDSYIELAERLNAIVPVSGAAKSIFFSTGAEALENAVKIARFATGRSAIISFVGAFHGRTLMTMAMTGKVAPYKLGFGALPADVYHVPFPNLFHDVTVDASISALETLFRVDVDPRRVAAIVVEPVQGEGGFYPAPPEFLVRVRELCDRHGILMIADEVQTGFARTGRMFALEHSGVSPDLITLAKSLGGGMPLSAVSGRAEVMDSVPPGGLGTTYGGNPLACAAALGVLDVIESENLCARATVLGGRLTERLKALQASNSVSFIGDIRSLGAMVAVEICDDGRADRPAPDIAKAIVNAAKEEGLILLTCGMNGNVLRFLFPLTIEDDRFADALGRLERAFRLTSELIQK